MSVHWPSLAELSSFPEGYSASSFFVARAETAESPIPQVRKLQVSGSAKPHPVEIIPN